MIPRPTTTLCVLLVASSLQGCRSAPEQDTIADLDRIRPDTADVAVDDGLRKAVAGYERFLEATPEHTMAPEAMRRVADLKLEREVGYVGVETPTRAVGEATDNTAARAPMAAAAVAPIPRTRSGSSPDPKTDTDDESFEQFEARTSSVDPLARRTPALPLPGNASIDDRGPRQAIATYRRILDEYPWYERNDQVLYQMARAYDELAEPDAAMEVVDRLLNEYPASKYAEEVLFRRGEYNFVRREFRAAEAAYQQVVDRGDQSDFFELALYKLGWSFYKQDLYEEALHRYVALLDHKRLQGYDFEQLDADAVPDDESADTARSDVTEEERRVADTFRIVSLSFSNLGGPESTADYFQRFGERDYEHRIYSNLSEFYRDKRRYADAADSLETFVALHPLHRIAPDFSRRVSGIYEEGGFPLLVVEAKRNFASRYGLDSEYWNHHAPSERPEVIEYLKGNLIDLAQHYHARYQSPDETEIPQRGDHFAEAERWYRAYLASFADDPNAPATHYHYSDLLRENGNYAEAALAYEHTAYEYGDHTQAAEAGYAAVFSHREYLKLVDEERAMSAQLATIDSSLRFADRFAEHEQAATVLSAAIEDLFGIQDYERSVAAGTVLLESHPGATDLQRRAAHVIVAHSNFELERFALAEVNYADALALTEADHDEWQSVVDNLAAAIYRQGEAERATGNLEGAAEHFLRIRVAAPASAIRPAAEYDAAVAYSELERWDESARVFEAFREAYPDHELAGDVTQLLANAYEQAGQLVRSAGEFERVANEAQDADLAADALLTAARLYEEALQHTETLRVYERYIDDHPTPLAPHVEVRYEIAELHGRAGDGARRSAQLEAIVELDAAAGSERTDRIRYLAAISALELTEPLMQAFVDERLAQPFEVSLAAKQQRMEDALAGYERLFSYEIAEVATAATFHIGEVYRRFSEDLMRSERPAGLSDEELAEYDAILVAEARPFESQALETHRQNLGLMRRGAYNEWTVQSVGRLAQMQPERYARTEISTGYVGSIEHYTYRMPSAPLQDAEGTDQIAGIDHPGPATGASND